MSGRLKVYTPALRGEWAFVTDCPKVEGGINTGRKGKSGRTQRSDAKKIQGGEGRKPKPVKKSTKP